MGKIEFKKQEINGSSQELTKWEVWEDDKKFADAVIMEHKDGSLGMIGGGGDVLYLKELLEHVHEQLSQLNKDWNKVTDKVWEAVKELDLRHGELYISTRKYERDTYKVYELNSDYYDEEDKSNIINLVVKKLELSSAGELEALNVLFEIFR